MSLNIVGLYFSLLTILVKTITESRNQILLLW